MSLTTFERLGLPSELVAALAARHITEPFAIQTLTLPDALDGRDILGRAPTGSGKTLAFGLPALARLAATDRAAKRRPRALILSPTRELADQIHKELEPLAKAVGRRVTSVYGGAAIGRQITALAKGVDLLVATPGRLLDLIDQGEVALADVEIAVVDEADRMADMGFLPDVRRILDQTADERQTVLFSATLDDDVQELTNRYQQDPVLHEIGEPEPDLSLMEHRFIKIKKVHRLGVAADLIIDAGGPTIVFVRTRHGVDRLARQLRQHGVKAGYIHGGRTQSQRTRALELFVDGKVDALVATDVAARGIHVDGVVCVLHYDPPADSKDYVHRSGRTARAGAGGTVISLIDPVQVKESAKMQRQLGIDAEFEAPPRPRPESERPAPVDDVTARPAPKAKSGSKTRSGSKPRSSRKPTGDARSSRKPAAAESEPTSRTRSTSKAKPARKSAGESRPARKSAGSSRSARTSASTSDDRRSDRSEQRNGKPTRSSGKAKAGSGGPGGKAGSGGPGGKARSGGPRKKAASGGPKSKATTGGPRASKRTGRPRPPNRKGKLTGRGRRSSSPS